MSDEQSLQIFIIRAVKEHGSGWQNERVFCHTYTIKDGLLAFYINGVPTDVFPPGSWFGLHLARIVPEEEVGGTESQ